MLTPLLVSQAGFFRDTAVQLVNPNKFNVSWRFTLPATREADVRNAVSVLWRHHSALRARFTTTGEHEFLAVDTSPPLRFFDLGAYPSNEHGAAIDRVTEEAGNTLSIEHGPLIRFLAFCEGGLITSLVAIAHHLVTDLYSWSVLQRNLSRLISGESSLPSDNYAAAVRAVDTFARSDRIRETLDEWVAGCKLTGGMPTAKRIVPATRIPRVHYWDLRLSTNAAGKLMAGVAIGDREAAATRLLAALGSVLTRKFQGPVFCLELKSGREMKESGLAQSAAVLPTGAHRAVGWFPVEAGLFLPIARKAESYETLVQRSRLQFEAHGVEFGFLRHLTDVETVEREVYDQGHGPQLWINHVHLPSSANRSIDVSTGSLGSYRPVGEAGNDPAFRGPPLAIDAHSGPSHLALRLTYDTETHSDEGVLDIVSQFVHSLGEEMHTIDMEIRR